MTPKNSAQLSVVSDQGVAIPNAINEVRPVHLKNLRRAAWNARKTFDAVSLAELKASIVAHGIQVPLLVRKVEKAFYVSQGEFAGDDSKIWYVVCKNSVGRENIQETFGRNESSAENRADAQESADKRNGYADYEIVAGHRRYQVAVDLKLGTVPCIVRELTDDQAREIGLVDNLQREDVPALEEADAYAELQQRLGTAAAIAQRVGKEASYVARRLQLVSLAEQPRKALAERLITVEHAALLARLGEDEQNTNLKWTLNPNSGIKEPVEETIKQRIQERDRKDRWAPWEPQSVLSLKHHIEEHVGRKLSRAPWDLDDATLIKDVPACNDCPSNTKHNDTLFGDLNIAAATCENGGCFEMKRLAFVSIRLSEATHKQDAGQGSGLGPAIRLSWKATTVKPRVSEAKAGSVMVDESGINLLQVFKHGQWVEAKPKSCEHVRLGVTVDWSDANDRGHMGGGEKLRKPGQVLNVCIAAKCKAHRKEWEKPKSENRNAPHDAKAEEAKREKTRIAALAETKLRVRIAGEAIAQVKSLHLGMLRELLLDKIPSGRSGEALKAILPGLETILRTEKIDSPAFAKAVALLNTGGHVEVWHYCEANSERKEFIADMKRLGYDASKAWHKPAEPKVQSTAAKKAAKPAAKKPAKKAAKKKGGRK